MSEDALRVGVVGLGKMGLLHASLLNILPQVKLAGVCEKSSLTRKFAKRAFRNIPIVSDVTEFSGLNLDAIYVTTPISSHYAVAKEVYRRHLAKHLFIEKPLTSNSLESLELCDLAIHNNSVNMVGYLRRFYVTFLKAKELLDQNQIGEPLSFAVSAFSSDFCGVQDDPTASIKNGGVLRDLGCYAIDIAYWFFGDFEVTSVKSESLTGPNAEDSVNFTVQQKSKPLQGEFSVSWCVEGYRMPEVVLSIKGSRGEIEVNDDSVSLSLNQGNRSTWFRHNLNDKVGFWLGNPEYYREDEIFVKSALANTLVEPNFKTASKVDSLIDTIHQKANKQ